MDDRTRKTYDLLRFCGRFADAEKVRDDYAAMVANDRRTKANANARARRSWARSAALDSHLNNLGV